MARHRDGGRSDDGRLSPLRPLFADRLAGWARIARDWEAAQGSDEAIKAFRNTVLGETWQERGEAPDWERLSDRREQFVAPVPDGALFLTAGADVQGNRIEVDVWAWGRGLESWLVDHVVIEGGPSTQEAWGGLDDLLMTTWTHQSGLEMKISRLCIDTGYETSAVYAWARQAGFGQVSPVKGVEGLQSVLSSQRADLRRRHGEGQEALPRCAAVDHSRLDLQVGDLSVPEPEAAD